MYRLGEDSLEVLLVHPGGPFWQNKDEGGWTISKGEPHEGEGLLEAACREFREETGLTSQGPYLELTPVRQKGGKVVSAWAFSGNCNPADIRSNTFAMEWPPRSGQRREFPEIDRAAYFSLEDARKKINPAQIALLDELAAKLNKVKT